MNASDLLVKALEQEGIEIVYGIPGEENLDLLEALRKSSIKLILTRHEQGAAFMAATYGRMTGKIGVAISTLGPGATNFTTSAAYANLGGFPILLITGQKPIKKSKQGRFQIIDVVAMMKPLCKYSKQIIDVAMVSSTVAEAVKIAKEEKPGCVHIEFPEDISAQKVEADTPTLLPKLETSYPIANPHALEKAVAMIKNAKFPLVLIGNAGSRNNLSAKITQFINTTKLPFFNTQMGKGAVAENNPQFIGTAALSAGDYLHEAIKKADLILSIGNDVIEKPGFFMEKDSAKVIHINYSSAILDNVYFPTLEVLGDIGATLDILGKSLGECSQDFSYAYKVRDFLLNHIAKLDNDNSFPIKPQKLVRDINKVMADGYVALDNGMYKLWFARNYQCLHPNSLLLDNALATMGAGLPSAMEVARLYPNKKVLAVVGDGGFMMNSQELETAIRLNLNLVVMILNDSGYGMIRWKQAGMKLQDFGLTFNNPDFVKYANAYGANGIRLSKTEELIPTLESCFKSGGVHLIDMPIDYSENKKVLLDELKNKATI
ncbi:MAG: acetolactate synthase large subunit [Alphaproteobacteria bacterium]|jgi:acetolactate synthase-1/2/3 large subunit|nr:acetolactate synthase large subunit [Alphaproteobacteria bacterium]